MLVVEADQVLVLEAVRKRPRFGARTVRAATQLAYQAIGGSSAAGRRCVTWPHAVFPAPLRRSVRVADAGAGVTFTASLRAERDSRLDHGRERCQHVVAMEEQVLDPREEPVDPRLVPHLSDDVDQHFDVEPGSLISSSSNSDFKPSSTAPIRSARSPRPT